MKSERKHNLSSDAIPPYQESSASQSKRQQKRFNSKQTQLGAFFKSTSSVSESVQDDPELTGTWIESEAPMLHYAYGDRPKLIERIVAFDMDSTLITTKGTHRFPKDHLDWQFLYTNTVQLLRRVVDKDGYHIVVFTNQAGFVRQPQRLPFFRLKIEAICQAIRRPMDVLVATQYDWFRKPRTGMWLYLKPILFQGQSGDTPDVKAVLAASIYVGDAAGRSRSWRPGAPADHSCADRQFALNVGFARFETPETFFRTMDPSSQRFELGFDPRPLKQTAQSIEVLKLYEEAAASCPLELVLIVGAPAVGKTQLCKRWFPKHVRIDQSELQSRNQCVRRAEHHLQSGQSVIVDHWNFNHASRQPYIELGRRLNIPVRCVWMESEQGLSMHCACFRNLTDKLHSQTIDMIPIRTFYAKFEEPLLEEGFTRLHRLPFLPEPVDPDRFYQFLV